MSETYYPLGTIMGPPTAPCQQAVVWDKGHQPFCAEIFIGAEPSLRVTINELGSCHDPAEFVAWLPLVPIELKPEMIEQITHPLDQPIP